MTQPKDEVEESFRKIREAVDSGKITVHVNPLRPGTIKPARPSVKKTDPTSAPHHEDEI